MRPEYMYYAEASTDIYNHWYIFAHDITLGTLVEVYQASTPTATDIPTSEEGEVPGFEAVFAVAGLLGAAYLLLGKKRK